MLPILERELVEKRHWTTMDDLRDYFSIGQCTPGIIALNVSTFIGEKKAGVKGAVAATTGFLTGPILIILIIAMFLQNFATIPQVQHAFAGIRVCVCVLILQAVLRLWKKSVVDPFTLGLYIAVFALHALSGLMPVKIPAAVLVILAGLPPISMNAMSSVKKPKKGIMISLSKQLALIVLLLAMPHAFGIDGVLYAGPVADLLAALCSALVISREFRKLGAQPL